MSHAWMPLAIDDYLADTRHLTTLEHGAYLLLIMRYWQKAGLPDDDRMVQRISGMDDAQWANSRDILASFFDDGWRHARIDAELEKAADIINKRRSAANRRHDCSKSDANAQLMHSTCSDTRVPPKPSTDISDTDVSDDKPILAQEPDDIAEAVEVYNAAATEVGWPRAQRITASRRAALKARLRECGGIEGWRAAMARARASPFLCGDSGRGWKADFDFLIKSSKFTKLMEGGYDRSDRSASGPGTQPARGATRSDLNRAAMVEALAGRADSRLSAAPPAPCWPDGGSEGARGGEIVPFGAMSGAGHIR